MNNKHTKPIDRMLPGYSTETFLKQHSATGSDEQAITNAFYGINITGDDNRLLDNRDVNGYTFFTRPQLNLSSANLQLVNSLYSLLTTKDNSVHRYVRMMLDPRLKHNDGNNPGIKSDIVDNKSAFIPVLTNTIKSISGWPDVVTPTHTSKEGLKKEQQSIVDGFVEIYNSFDLDVSFRNIREEPMTIMFTTWLTYMAKVFEGDMMPYLDMITENEIDYNTRIYRIVTGDISGQVKKIAATGASFPISVPTGKFFDQADGSPLNVQNKDINIRFKCDGAMYNEQVLMTEFNDTVAIFNPAMRKLINGESDHGLEKVPVDLIYIINHRAYPHINRSTNILEWWIEEELLKEIENN